MSQDRDSSEQALVDKGDVEFACFILENRAGHALRGYELAAAREGDGHANPGEVAFAGRSFNIAFRKLLEMRELAESLPSAPAMAEILRQGFHSIKNYEETVWPPKP